MDYDSDWLERDDDGNSVHNSTMFDNAPMYAADVTAKFFEDPMNPVIFALIFALSVICTHYKTLLLAFFAANCHHYFDFELKLALLFVCQTPTPSLSQPEGPAQLPHGLFDGNGGGVGKVEFMCLDQVVVRGGVANYQNIKDIIGCRE